jgi:hypothetical protein
MTIYVLWTAIAATGIPLVYVDRRWIGRPLFGALLVAGICGGLIAMQVSPFNFSDGGYALQGLLVMMGSAVALIGYAAGALWLSFSGRSGRPRNT